MRILLADEQRIFREGLMALLDRAGGFLVVGETGDGRRAVELAASRGPDLVLIEAVLPGLTGIEAVRQICREESPPRILALAARSDAQTVNEMLRAGAAGYVLKSCGVDELMAAIRAVREGESWLSPAAARAVVESQVRPVDDAEEEAEESIFSLLTPREREVLQLVAEGFRSREIADRLHISPKTVDTHRHNLSRKVGASTVADLVKLAIREGLTSWRT